MAIIIFLALDFKIYNDFFKIIQLLSLFFYFNNHDNLIFYRAIYKLFDFSHAVR